jgi:hypothetical protein
LGGSPDYISSNLQLIWDNQKPSNQTTNLLHIIIQQYWT